MRVAVVNNTKYQVSRFQRWRPHTVGGHLDAPPGWAFSVQASLIPTDGDSPATDAEELQRKELSLRLNDCPTADAERFTASLAATLVNLYDNNSIVV